MSLSKALLRVSPSFRGGQGQVSAVTTCDRAQASNTVPASRGARSLRLLTDADGIDDAAGVERTPKRRGPGESRNRFSSLFWKGFESANAPRVAGRARLLRGDVRWHLEGESCRTPVMFDRKGNGYVGVNVPEQGRGLQLRVKVFDPKGVTTLTLPRGARQSELLIDDGITFASCPHSQLSSYDASGELRWELPYGVGLFVTDAPVRHPDGSIVALVRANGSASGETSGMKSIDPLTGHIRPLLPEGAVRLTHCPPDFDRDGRMFLVDQLWESGKSRSALKAFNPDGTLAWEHVFEEGNSAMRAVVGPNGDVAVRCAFQVTLFDRNGQKRWSVPCSPEHYSNLGGVTFGVGGMLYWKAGTDGGREHTGGRALFARHVDGGTVHSLDVSAEIIGKPAFDRAGRVNFATRDGRVHTADATLSDRRGLLLERPSNVLEVTHSVSIDGRGHVWVPTNVGLAEVS